MGKGETLEVVGKDDPAEGYGEIEEGSNDGLYGLEVDDGGWKGRGLSAF